MATWRIYYSDGSTYSDDDGPPELAPGWGVIVIPQADPEVGRIMLARWDHYCWHPESGQWWGHDFTGLIDCLALPGPNIVMHGRTVPQEVYRAIWDQAISDPDFQPRSGIHPLERGGDPS